MRRAIDSGWVLRAARVARGGTDPGLVAARVPGCVHTDLLEAGAIPDPFLNDNEQRVAWVGESDWTYATTFVLDPDEVPSPPARLDLVCDGLDTMATVSLNGTVVGRTENMYRRYRFDVSEVVRAGTNVLTVEFRSAVVEALARRERDGAWPCVLPGRPFNQIRKMACSWGWDWGPFLNTAGIWRGIGLEWSKGARLASVRPVVRCSGASGTVDVHVEIDGDAATTVVAELTAVDGRAVARDVGGPTAAHLTVDGVQRWWPHTMGEQPLYRLDVSLVDAHGAVIDTWSRRIGFRAIELDTSTDEIGRQFAFVVNGKLIFAKGVNWIPDDVFPSRVGPERYRARLHDAVDAGVDLVRIWGGGIYEDDKFYDACDELGVMVWQDFCFACAAYPEEHLDAEVQAEARDNVVRLMPHPSLALWNGNNENIWGFHDWGWQELLDGRPWGATWYHDALPAIVAELDPGRAYWPGSPYSGAPEVAPNDDEHGCSHLWDVWNTLDYEHYRDHIPRFAAEFGWQAPAAWSTLRAALSGELRVDSPTLANHQKADRGDRKLARGLDAHLGTPRSFDAWLWATQLLQARAVSTAIEHMRSWRGRCMGTIWWQLNDCWPVVSWSVVDSAGQRKPAWYALRAAYAPRLATIQPRDDTLVLALVNDRAEPWHASGTVDRHGVDGTVRKSQMVSVEVAPASVHLVPVDRGVATPSDPRDELLVADIEGTRRATWWFAPDRDLALPHKQLTARASHTDDCTVAVDITAGSLLVDLALFPDRLAPGARVDDQLVTLLPGEDHRFVVTFPEPIDVEPARFATAPVLWTVNSLLR